MVDGLLFLVDFLLYLDGILLAGIFFVLVAAVQYRMSSNAKVLVVSRERELSLKLLSLASFFLLADLLVKMFSLSMHGDLLTAGSYFFVNHWVAVDFFVLGWKFVIFFIIFFVFRCLTFSLETNRYLLAPEIPLLLLLATFGAYGVFHSSHLFLTCVYFEVLSLSLVVIPYLSTKYSNLAIEGALLFLVISFVASIAFFIFGLSFLYVSASDAALGLKSKDFLQSCGLSSLVTYYVGCFFVNCCFFIKLTLWPWHGWVRNLYEAISWDILALFAVFSKVIAGYLLIVLNVPMPLASRVFLGESSLAWVDLSMLVFWPFYIFALISAYYGALAPLYDTRVSRLLAFSGINFAGNFVLLLSGANSFSVAMAIYFLFLYVMNILGVLGVLSFFWRWLRRVTDFAGFLHPNNAAISFLLTVLLLNFAGLPPLLLFFGKLTALGVIFAYNGSFIAFNFLLSNTIVMVVYIRILRFLWFGFKQQGHGLFTFLLLPKKYGYFFVSFLVLLVSLNIFFIFGFDIVFSIILNFFSMR